MIRGESSDKRHGSVSSNITMMVRSPPKYCRALKMPSTSNGACTSPTKKHHSSPSTDKAVQKTRTSPDQQDQQTITRKMIHQGKTAATLASRTTARRD